jgi:hypothetical protein
LVVTPGQISKDTGVVLKDYKSILQIF